MRNFGHLPLYQCKCMAANKKKQNRCTLNTKLFKCYHLTSIDQCIPTLNTKKATMLLG